MKKKTFIRMAALLMIPFIVGALMAGCKKSDPDNEGEPTTYWDPWETTTEPTTEEPATEEPTTDETTEEVEEPDVTTSRRTTTVSRKTTTKNNTTKSTTKTTTKTTKTTTNNILATIPDNTAKPSTTTTTKPPTTTTTTTTAYYKVTGLSFNSASKNIALNKGDTHALKYALTPSNATNKNVRFTTSNANVATVASNGTVTAAGAGTATITVTTLDPNADRDYSDTMTVTVAEIAVTGFEIYGNSMLRVGETATLSVRNFKGEGGKTPTSTAVEWSSSDPNCVSVDANGKLTARYPGACTITATAKDSKGFSVSVSAIATNT